MIFDYYYGVEAEQFSFIRIPKTLFTEEKFKKLSTDAKVLYGLLLDRLSLSVKNNWLDEQNRVYIHYTLENIMQDLGYGHNKCVKIIQELDDKKGIGLIERKKQGLGRPDIIYVKNFLKILENDEKSVPESAKIEDFPKSEVLTSSKRNSGLPKKGIQDFPKSEANNTNNNKTNTSKTKSSAVEISMPVDDDYFVQIKSNINYNSHINNKEYIELYKVIEDTFLSKNKYIRIGKTNYLKESVKSKFLSLREWHFKYVIKNLKESDNVITDRRAYLLTALYNSLSVHRKSPENDFFRYESRNDYDMQLLEKAALSR